MRFCSITTISNPPATMIMGAGLGTRFRPISNIIPKPVAPLMGVPLAQFTFDLLMEHGWNHAVMNYHSLPQIMLRELRKISFSGKLLPSDETAKLLGSAGGIRNALGLLGDSPFFGYLNPDVLTSVDLSQLLRSHLSSPGDPSEKITLHLMRLPRQGKYRGFKVSPEGIIDSVGEKSAPDDQFPFMFASAALLGRRTIEKLSPQTESDLLQEIILPAIKAGRAWGYIEDGYWRDLGTVKDWTQAHGEILDALENPNQYEIPERILTRAARHNCRLSSRIWAHQFNAKDLFPKIRAPSYLGDRRFEKSDAGFKSGIRYDFGNFEIS